MFMPLLAVALACPAPALADAVWLGIYQHDVTLAQEKFETGQDIKAGWIGNRLPPLGVLGRPSPHALVSKSLNGGTNYVAAGLNWTFGSKLYLRPGIGIALNDGPNRAYRNGKRVDLGSFITFEPELAVGWRINDRIAIETSWIHLSHATLFSRQNRGMDSMGVRAVFQLDR
ncbi:MAG: acyloxyacyl hydrolase [Sphingomonadaceae bacterium]